MSQETQLSAIGESAATVGASTIQLIDVGIPGGLSGLIAGPYATWAYGLDGELATILDNNNPATAPTTSAS